MELQLPSSPRRDMVMKAPSKHPPVPPLFKAGELSSGRQWENDKRLVEGELSSGRQGENDKRLVEGELSSGRQGENDKRLVEGELSSGRQGENDKRLVEGELSSGRQGENDKRLVEGELSSGRQGENDKRLVEGELSSGRQGENDKGGVEGEGNGEHWFFNMKVHHPPSHNYAPSQPQPRKNHHLDPVRQTKASRGHAKKSREQSRATCNQGRAAKPLVNRHRKLGAIDTPSPTIPSPAELREQIDIQTARSIGDSLIFHNIPERCEDTPEAEVVKFCQDYLVGRRRINHVHFGHVHKMEDRFGKDAPITARFTLTMPGPADQPDEEKYQPLPYIPPVPRRKLPILRGKNRRQTVYSADL
ncbi:uncharacterized protein [Littorina saxatilis]|uniref:Uncharacterized protein n=1 Tax=Littorina saxatilis TaxID=31220 RepID=A0AAN9B655_9CAEN